MPGWPPSEWVWPGGLRLILNFPTWKESGSIECEHLAADCELCKRLIALANIATPTGAFPGTEPRLPRIVTEPPIVISLGLTERSQRA